MRRVLAVDPGGRRVGVAVSDPTGTIAQPLTAVPAEPAGTLAERLAELAREQEATRLVVGLPRRLDGSQGPEARAARVLAGELRRASGLPVGGREPLECPTAADRLMPVSSCDPLDRPDPLLRAKNPRSGSGLGAR